MLPTASCRQRSGCRPITTAAFRQHANRVFSSKDLGRSFDLPPLPSPSFSRRGEEGPPIHPNPTTWLHCRLYAEAQPKAPSKNGLHQRAAKSWSPFCTVSTKAQKVAYSGPSSISKTCVPLPFHKNYKDFAMMRSLLLTHF
jgi:hypothetical protein